MEKFEATSDSHMAGEIRATIGIGENTPIYKGIKSLGSFGKYFNLTVKMNKIDQGGDEGKKEAKFSLEFPNEVISSTKVEMGMQRFSEHSGAKMNSLGKFFSVADGE